MCPTEAPNGTNGVANEADRVEIPVASAPRQNRSNPYQPVGDYLSNVGRFKIIESTLREGEQFANAYFTLDMKIKMYVVLRVLLLQVLRALMKLTGVIIIVPRVCYRNCPNPVPARDQSRMDKH